MNVIIDYGVGNLNSVQLGFKRAGIETVISSDYQMIQQANALILPGVGAFEDAMNALKRSGLIPYIINHVQKNKYLFGICLGMQLLYEKGYENGEHEGLGLLKGTIRYLDINEKIPHMGWNSLYFQQKDASILKYINEGDFVYFVHSYYVDSNQDDLVAYTKYERKVPAIVMNNHIIATQFHPEKSGDVGLSILKAFGELIT